MNYSFVAKEHDTFSPTRARSPTCGNQSKANQTKPKPKKIREKTAGSGALDPFDAALLFWRTGCNSRFKESDAELID